MPFRSDLERRAFYARKNRFSSLSSIEPIFKESAEFNARTNKELIGGIKKRLGEKSLHDFIKETDKELNAGIPRTITKRLKSLVDSKDSYFEKNKFSNGDVVDVELDPVKYTTGIIIEEAIRNYDLNKEYYLKYDISKEDLILIELAKNNILGQESNVSV